MLNRYSILQFIIVFLVINIVSVCSQSEVDDPCTVQRTGAKGTCKLIKNCPSAIDDLRNRRSLTTCGFQGRYQIVCCANPPTKPPIKPKPSIDTINSARISVKKCYEYKDAVYEKQFINTPFNDYPVEKNVSTCGFISIPLIVGGMDATAREFPHMALIGYQDGDSINWGCGGTLISDEYILTAAHCIKSRDFGQARYVKLGALKLHSNSDADDSGDPIDVNVAEAIKHPHYRSSQNYHDIGLIRLQRKIQFNRFTRPACLYDKMQVHNEKAIASGWGRVEWGGNSSDRLLKVILELFSYRECRETFEISRHLNRGIDDTTQLCAGSHTDIKDTCQGDSGGPLQVYHEHHHCMYSIIGITSFGKACGVAGTPAVYTQVSAYLDWIESVVWPDDEFL